MATRFWLDVSGDWNATANWSGATVPVSTDDVYILAGSQAINTNLGQSAVTLNSLHIGMGFLGTIGTSTTPLAISATTWEIGVPAPAGSAATGSSRIWIDFGINIFTGTVWNTSNNPLDIGTNPVDVKGSNAGNLLTVYAGYVGVGAKLATDSATILTGNYLGGSVTYGVAVGFTTVNVGTGAYFTCNGLTGSGGTITSAPGSTVTVNGSNKLTVVNVGGNVYAKNRGAANAISDTVTLFSTGKFDVSGNTSTGTFGVAGSFTWYKGGVVVTNSANPDHVTWSNLSRKNGGTLTLS